MIRTARYLLAAGLLLTAMPAAAQYQDPAPLQAAQRTAMQRLAFMDGVWRGPAWSLTPGGRRDMIQTERAGTFVGGTVRVFEGRGYDPDGQVGFNALGVVSFDPASGRYSLSTWALGRHATVPLTITETGFVWETPAGPGAIIRYTATIRDGTWHEVGEIIAPGRPPLRVVELSLRRVGDSDWPGAGAVPMR